MNLVAELRTRARHVIGPVLGILAIAYFGFHAIHGDRGLLAWWQLRQQVETARASLHLVAEEKDALTRRVRLLHPESLDPDMLEERVRIMLNYGHIDDIVALDQKRRK